ncbi:hypothetical protein SAMN04487897_1695 [Paenibacillus sp. yr247]|uniref:hypothetical protein n=1 Tax=Paenibacillus sp. yr247 TaxID=1761880 RepID=UPI000890DAAD|nr:hypothetical protein [Paenibacillus sp. yr247]SDP29731.1 hypothetical protein SAMN04487897_1695 [Paenibacillus sp. yr247]
MNPEKLIKPDERLGNVVKVYEVLEYIVLAELMKKNDYAQNLEQTIIKSLANVGVNKGFLSQRLTSLIESGKVEKIGTDPDHRSRQLLRITEAGIEYFKRIASELPAKVKLAKKTYTAFEAYMDQYATMSLKQGEPIK